MRYFSILLAILSLCSASVEAQTDTPFYEPCEGVYYVGTGAGATEAVMQPTLVAPAYGAKFKTCNTLVAAAVAGGKSYALQKYLVGDTLDLTTFMGVGTVSKLMVRNASGSSYQLGNGSPNDCVLWASYNYTSQTNGERLLPLSMYNHWDYPMLYGQDDQLAATGGVKVQFSKPGEGLIVKGLQFDLLGEGLLEGTQLKVTLTEGSNTEEFFVDANRLAAQGEKEGHSLYAVKIDLKERVMTDAFAVTISGFGQEGAKVWMPRTDNTGGRQTTHSTYCNGSDTQGREYGVNVLGYYNYIGDWGIPHGKQERGEVVSEGDYVQIFYDPSEEGYLGRFQGEVTFPVECTFGMDDIYAKECPEWIVTGMDDSQWAENEALFLIMQAEALPEDVPGRMGKVVFSTLDNASEYTILVIQGAAWFDGTTSLKTIVKEQAASSKRISEGHLVILHEGERYELTGNKQQPKDK